MEMNILKTPRIKKAIEFFEALKIILIHDYKTSEDDAVKLIEDGSSYNFTNTLDFLNWVEKKIRG